MNQNHNKHPFMIQTCVHIYQHFTQTLIMVQVPGQCLPFGNNITLSLQLKQTKFETLIKCFNGKINIETLGRGGIGLQDKLRPGS